MYDLLSAVCGCVVILFALLNYWRYRDAFHPAVFTAPLMIAGYSIWPLILNRSGDLEFLLGSSDLVYIQSYYLVGLLAFFLSMTVGVKRRTLAGMEISPWYRLSGSIKGISARSRLIKLALIFGAIALLAYWYAIFNVGGFTVAYSRYKGGGSTGSGYIGEATLLAYPAVFVYALARQGRGFRATDWLLVLLMISPNLLQGTIGVRRGPLFISLATLFVSWVVARGRVPGVFKTTLSLSAIVGAVVFVWSNRRAWFQEGRESSNLESLDATLLPDAESLVQNDFVSGVGSALICDYYNVYFWGKRWLVDLVIRPIPRQVWPNKYEDVGAYWKAAGNPSGFSELEQIHVLGFPLPQGYSIGVLSDLYSEWWWFGVVVMGALGAFLRWMWVKHRTIGQVWTAMYLAGMGLCIYLPTQSFSAWYQRYMIMAVVTLLAWRWVVGKDVREAGSGARGALASAGADPVMSRRV